MQISISVEADPDYVFLQPDESGNLYYLTNHAEQQNDATNLLTVVKNNHTKQRRAIEPLYETEIIGYDNESYAVHLNQYGSALCDIYTSKINEVGPANRLPGHRCFSNDDIQINSTRIAYMRMFHWFYPEREDVHDLIVSESSDVCGIHTLRCQRDLGFHSITAFLLLNHCIVVENLRKLLIAKFYA